MTEDVPAYNPSAGKPGDAAAVSAFEETFQADSRDPSVARDLKVWLLAWHAAKRPNR